MMWHNPAVLTNVMGLGRKIQKWDKLDPNLKSFASMAVAHPENQVFAAYRSRADALLGGQAIVFLDDLYERIGALRR